MGETQQEDGRGIAVVLENRRAAKVRQGSERREQFGHARNGALHVLVDVRVVRSRIDVRRTEAGADLVEGE